VPRALQRIEIAKQKQPQRIEIAKQKQPHIEIWKFLFSKPLNYRYKLLQKIISMLIFYM
jgi:hypothetical protein